MVNAFDGKLTPKKLLPIIDQFEVDPSRVNAEAVKLGKQIDGFSNMPEKLQSIFTKAVLYLRDCATKSSIGPIDKAVSIYPKAQKPLMEHIAQIAAKYIN